MIGADPVALDDLAGVLDRRSQELADIAANVQVVVFDATWFGPDAEWARHSVTQDVTSKLSSASRYLADLAAEVRTNADQQRRASQIDHLSRTTLVSVGMPVRLSVAGFPRVGFRTGHLAGSPDSFAAPTDGRAAIVSALDALEHGSIERDEIQLRRLDNGRYIVVVPGVTDLTENAKWAALGIFNPIGVLTPVALWAFNDENTVRKTKYAANAIRKDDSDLNEYSMMVLRALRDAGVPADAQVAVVGHSFGAYAAMDLAVWPGRGDADAARDLDGYKVDFTHVVAAGADTDWRLDEIADDTKVLIVNNNDDQVVQIGENVFHDDARPRGHHQVEYNFDGGFRGLGHDEVVYKEAIESTNDRPVTKWLSDFGRNYAVGGTVENIKVPDPN